MKTVTFIYEPPIVGNHQVYLVANSDNWDKHVIELVETNGKYLARVSLKEGMYYYRFKVDGKYMKDPNAPFKLINGVELSLIEVKKESKLIALHTFEKVIIDYEGKLSLVGDFNNWIPDTNRLAQISKGQYKTSLFLESGEYEYKYLAEAGIWVNQDSVGHYPSKKVQKEKLSNSKVVIDSSSMYSIDSNLLSSYSNNKLVFNSQLIDVYKYSDKQVEIKFRIPFKSYDKLKIVIDGIAVQYYFSGKNKHFTVYYSNIDLASQKAILKLEISFEVNETRCFINNNILNLDNKDSIHYIIVQNLPKFNIPKFKDALVMYQILVDRFHNGDEKINPTFKESYYSDNFSKPSLNNKLHKNQAFYHLAEWNDISILKKNPYSAQANPDWHAFYGGDLAGIRKKIAYLINLGVNVIYLNPIFQAKSYHRYDTIDFQLIDPHLGTNEEFKQLVNELHDNGVKVILDIALNHCGTAFFAFEDCLSKGKDSLYWDWFDWFKWPLPKELTPDFVAEDYYKCWWGVKDLPEFNFDLSRETPDENYLENISDAEVNYPLTDYLLTSMEMWVNKYNIDGFRLDVPEEVPFWFWRLFYDHLKAINPDLYIVGEIWSKSSIWLKDNYVDAVMNYHYFRNPVIDYFIHNSITRSEFLDSISTSLISNCERVNNLQMNILGTHDTKRLRHICNSDLSKIKLALVFQFTFKGIPHIYYGDEIFLDGENDPDNRRPFDWAYREKTDSLEIHAFYKSLVSIRKKFFDCFQGIIKFYDSPYILSYTCSSLDAKKSLLVLINNSNQSVKLANLIESTDQIILTDTDKATLEPKQFLIALKS